MADDGPGSAVPTGGGGRTQGGEATETTLRSFLLAGEAQLHDLHSKLHLQHPHGVAAQLHKRAPVWPCCVYKFDADARVASPLSRRHIMLQHSWPAYRNLVKAVLVVTQGRVRV